MEINTKQQKPALGDRISVDPGYGTPTEGIVFAITPMHEGAEDAYDSYNIACPNGLTYTKSSKQKITILERANYTYAPRGHFRIGDLASFEDGTRAILLSDGSSQIGECKVVSGDMICPYWVAEQELTLIHAANHPQAPVDELTEALEAPKAAVDMSRAELDREIDEFCAHSEEEIML